MDYHCEVVLSGNAASSNSYDSIRCVLQEESCLFLLLIVNLWPHVLSYNELSSALHSSTLTIKQDS